MSDDDDYYDDLYDDGDDWIYFDDASLELADELAEHILPSPVFQDDPRFEMMESYSDWEYYSDDYYDDDPTVMNAQASGKPPSSHPRKTTKGRKKRKLAKTDDIPDLDIGSAVTTGRDTLFRGVVWRGPSPEDPAPYVTGEREKVALLKNWREVFRDSQPKFILKRKAHSKISRQKGSTPELDQLFLEEEELEDEDEPPRKRTKSGQGSAEAPVQANGVKSKVEAASGRTTVRKKQANKETVPLPNKKRKAGGQEEMEEPTTKKAATEGMTKETQPLPKRATRSRKAGS